MYMHLFQNDEWWNHWLKRRRRCEDKLKPHTERWRSHQPYPPRSLKDKAKMTNGPWEKTVPRWVFCSSWFSIRPRKSLRTFNWLKLSMLIWPWWWPSLSSKFKRPLRGKAPSALWLHLTSESSYETQSEKHICCEFL